MDYLILNENYAQKLAEFEVEARITEKNTLFGEKMFKQIILENENIKARICEWGSDDKPTIVCIHGLGSTCLSFLEVGEFLGDEYHIFSVELPGHGKTPAFKTDEEYEIPNLVKWLDDVINLVENDSFYLLAHSWGGCLALHYAANYPNKVKKILLIDGGYHVKQFEYEYFSKIDKNKLDFLPSCSLQEEINAYKADFDGYIFSSWEEFLEVEKNNYLRFSKLLEKASKDLMKEEDGKIKFCASGDVARGAIKSMYNYPTDVLGNKLKAPILLLVATLPESWMEIRNIEVEKFQLVTNAVVKKIDNTTHLLHWDNPNLVVEYVKKWTD